MYRKLILFFLFIAILCPAVFAERVVLKTGESFDGTIIDRNDQFITLQTGGAPVYLSMDQIAEIIEADSQGLDPHVPQQQNKLVTQQPDQFTAQSDDPEQSQETKVIDGKDGQVYYKQAIADFNSSNFKESASNLYLAVSLGAQDSEGLKDKIQQALSAVPHEKIKELGKELGKEILPANLDSDSKEIISRVAIVAAVMMLIMLIVKFMKREKKELPASPLFKRRQPDHDNTVSFLKAGPNKRVCAYLIDSLLMFIPSTLLQIFIGPQYGTMIWVVYFLLKDCFDGQSVGKRVVGIRVINVDGQAAGVNQSLMRNLFWLVVSVLPLFHPYLGLLSFLIVIIEYVTMVRDRNGQRVGDKISLTKVCDLKPHISDGKFLLWSVLVIIIYLTLALGVAKILHGVQVAASKSKDADVSQE